MTDSRQRVVFHTSRHTFASWLVEHGTDLYTVKEPMGHGALRVTGRYSRLAPDTPRRGVKNLERNPAAKADDAKVVTMAGSKTKGSA